jgi:hypothetical protein
VIGRQLPTGAILLDGQLVRGPDVPAQHAAFPAAIQADDVIAANRLPD